MAKLFLFPKESKKNKNKKKIYPHIYMLYQTKFFGHFTFLVKKFLNLKGMGGWGKEVPF